MIAVRRAELLRVLLCMQRHPLQQRHPNPLPAAACSETRSYCRQNNFSCLGSSSFLAGLSSATSPHSARGPLPFGCVCDADPGCTPTLGNIFRTSCSTVISWSGGVVVRVP